MTSVLPRLPDFDARSPSRVGFKMGAEGVLYVGQRVSCGGDFGTVKYVGPVPPTKGEWVGIEWDHPGRGKHNGSKDGVVYFECAHEEGGSFVRPHKLTTGISVVKAIVDRYAGSDLSFSGFDGKDTYLEKPGSLKKTKIEAVGMEEAYNAFKNLNGLTMVGLRMQDISHVGDEDFLRVRAPNIEELDLSKNLFDEWESIAKISRQLSKLRQLNLTENRLQIPDYPKDLTKNFLSLRVIILNCCGLRWRDVMSCLPMWPQIEEVHLDKNQITDISPPSVTDFPTLKMINFSDNPIKNWGCITNLAKLPSLEKLILTGCGLSDAKIGTGDFPSLTKLTLSSNNFSTEEVFNQLNNLPRLSELMFQKNPVLDDASTETMREIIIAKIGQLEMLNRTKIDALERQGSELDYMKKNGKYWRESGGNQDPEKNTPSEAFMRDHPRYIELVKIHGAFEDGEFLIKSTALKSNLLEVTITVPEIPEIKPLRKKLPHSMTVGALKVMIFRLLKLPIKEQRLEYVSHHNPEHIVQMSKDSETLYYISLENSDTINVHSKWSDIKWSAKSLK